MAFQKSNIKLEGNIGDLNFYKSGDEYRVRQKSGKKSKSEISNLAKRSKENALEFGRVSSFTKNIQSAFKNTLRQHYELFHESSIQNRLVKRINLIMKADQTSERGKRRILPINLHLLKNFSFNSNAAVKDTLLLPIEVDFNKKQQEITINTKHIHPVFQLDIPKETTSFMFHMVLFKIKHSSMEITGQYTNSELLSIRELHPAIHLVCSGNDLMESENILVAFGISLYQETGGYPVPQISPNLNCFDFLEIFSNK